MGIVGSLNVLGRPQNELQKRVVCLQEAVTEIGQHPENRHKDHQQHPHQPGSDLHWLLADARQALVEPSEVVYQLKPADPAMVAELEKLQAPQGMSARTALMAGLVIGITLMIGVLGALAWRAKVAEEELQNLPPPVNATDAAAPKK